jgi:competence protein ComEA
MQMNMKRTAGFVLTALTILMCAQALVATGTAGVVNINTATVEQLALLPRVGPSVAGRIVEFREQNGNFKDTSDLLLVKGIGDKTFELIEPYIAISGKTSLSEKVKVVREGGTSASSTGDWSRGTRG